MTITKMHLPEDVEMVGNDWLPIAIKFVLLSWMQLMLLPLKDLSVMMSCEV